MNAGVTTVQHPRLPPEIAKETLYSTLQRHSLRNVCVCGEAHARAPLCECGVDLAATVTCIIVTIVMVRRGVGGGDACRAR